MTQVAQPYPPCRNCEAVRHGPVCHVCGQQETPLRWNTRILLRQFAEQLTNIEKGFLATALKLLVAPGELIHGYWNGRTVNYYHPFRFVLIWVALNFLVNFGLGIDDLLQDALQPAFIEDEFSESQIGSMDQRFDSWLNIVVLLLIPVNSLFTRLLFRRREKNYAEHLIMNSYMIGEMAAVSTFTQIIFYLVPGLFPMYLLFNFLVGLTYNTWVFFRVFKEKLITVFLKALVFGVAGALIFLGFVSLAGILAMLMTTGF